jgi:hypothetical protein
MLISEATEIFTCPGVLQQAKEPKNEGLRTHSLPKMTLIHLIPIPANGLLYLPLIIAWDPYPSLNQCVNRHNVGFSVINPKYPYS